MTAITAGALPGPVERVSGFYRRAEDGAPLHRRWDEAEWGQLIG